jgi:hypothetical protein
MALLKFTNLKRIVLAAAIAGLMTGVCLKTLAFEPPPPNYQVHFIWWAYSCANLGIVADCRQSSTIYYLNLYTGAWEPANNLVRYIVCPPGTGESPTSVQTPTANQYYPAKNNALPLYTVAHLSVSTLDQFWGYVYVTDLIYDQPSNIDFLYRPIPGSYCI